jgi:hypothetical protein
MGVHIYRPLLRGDYFSIHLNFTSFGTRFPPQFHRVSRRNYPSCLELHLFRKTHLRKPPSSTGETFYLVGCLFGFQLYPFIVEQVNMWGFYNRIANPLHLFPLGTSQAWESNRLTAPHLGNALPTFIEDSSFILLTSSGYHHHKHDVVAIMQKCVKLVVGNPFPPIEQHLDHWIQLALFVV